MLLSNEQKMEAEAIMVDLMKEFAFAMDGYCILDEEGNELPVYYHHRKKLRELGFNV